MEKQEFINKINERLNNGQNAYFRFNKDVDFHTVVKYTRIFKKEFPNTYINRYKYEGQWTIVFHAGDKETQEFLNKPIKFETPRQQFNREFKKDMEDLRNTYNR